MTTANDFRSNAAGPTGRDVLIAGVPWPTYKLVALAIGVLVLIAVAVVTSSAAPAVLTAAAATTAVWLVMGITQREH